MSWRLLLTATLLFTSSSLAWSACGFKNLEPINTTVNSTVSVECRSNCTPLALHHMISLGNDSTERSIGSQVVSKAGDQYPYIIRSKISLHLDLSYNNTWLVCAIVPQRIFNHSVLILLQSTLQPVSGLDVVINGNHMHFTWLSPPVLAGIEVLYHVQFYHKGKIFYNLTLTDTFFNISNFCPCHEIRFDVTPLAGALVGQSKQLNRYCDKDDPKLVLNEENFKSQSQNNTVMIAFQINDTVCVPSSALMTASCHYNRTNLKPHSFHNITLLSDQRLIPLLNPPIAGLPAHDFCNISMTVVFNSGFELKRQFTNISLFDTQSIVVEKKTSSLAICVKCIFAPWIRQGECFIHIHILNLRNSTNQTAHLNGTGTPTKCFENLPTNELYNIDIFVGDSLWKNRVAVFNQTSINFTSSGPPDTKSHNGDPDLWWKVSTPLFLIVFIAVIALVLVAAAICCICSKQGGSKLEESKIEENSKPDLEKDGVPHTCCDGIDMKGFKGQEKRNTLAVRDIDSEKHDSEHYTLEPYNPEDVLQTFKSTSEHQGGFNQATGNMTDKSGGLKHDYGVPTPENGFLRFRGPQGQNNSRK